MPDQLEVRIHYKGLINSTCEREETGDAYGCKHKIGAYILRYFNKIKAIFIKIPQFLNFGINLHNEWSGFYLWPIK